MSCLFKYVHDFCQLHSHLHIFALFNFTLICIIFILLFQLGFQWTRSPETYTEALGLETVDVADRLKVLQGVAKAASVKIAEKGRAKDDENWNTRL